MVREVSVGMGGSVIEGVFGVSEETRRWGGVVGRDASGK